MIFKQQLSISITVSVLVMWMDVASGMSIELIPQHPVVQGSVTVNVITGITERVLTYTWFKGSEANSDLQILAYFPNDKDPIARGPLYQDRMTVLSNGSLRIFNLNIEDEENYVVKVQPQSSLPFDISVYLKIYKMVGKPTITASDLHPKENYTITLTCDSTDEERIEWSRVPSGATLSPNNKTLTFSRIDRSDSGDYRCTAKNLVSAENSDSITITVAYGPEHVNITSYSHPSFSLECSADSVPAATYQWKLNGTVIDVQQNPLPVDKTKAKNEGIYTCVAINSVTQNNATYSKYVTAINDNPATDGPGNNSVIIGSVIAVILVLVLVAALVYLFFVHRRHKRHSDVKSSSIKTISQTNPSAAAPEPPELQYADIIFSKNIPKRQPPPPESMYANHAAEVHPQETVYSELRLK